MTPNGMRTIDLSIAQYDREVERRHRERVFRRVACAVNALTVLVLLGFVGALLWLWVASEPPRMTAEEAERETARRAAAYQSAHPEEDYVERVR